MRVGTVMSLTESATGRAFAAFDARAQAAVLAQHPDSRLQSELGEVRSRGLARAVGRPIPGINAFAAPVMARGVDEVLYVVLVTGRAETFDAEWSSAIASELAACVNALKAR